MWYVHIDEHSVHLTSAKTDHQKMAKSTSLENEVLF